MLHNLHSSTDHTFGFGENIAFDSQNVTPRSIVDALHGAGLRSAEASVQRAIEDGLASVGWSLERNCSIGKKAPSVEGVVAWLRREVERADRDSQFRARLSWQETSVGP